MNPEAIHRHFEFLWLRKRFADALPVAKSGVTAAMQKKSGDHLALARALFDVAMAQKANGFQEEFLHNHEQAQAMLAALRQKALANPHEPATADLYVFEAEHMWWDPGCLPEARRRLEDAQKIREANEGPDHPLTAEVISRRAELEFVSGQFAAAEPFYRWALRLFEASGRRRGSTYRKTLQGLAQTIAALERHTEAEPLLSRAILESENWPEEKHVLYFLHMARADSLEKLKRPSEAQNARAQAEALLPKSHPGQFGYNPGV